MIFRIFSFRFLLILLTGCSVQAQPAYISGKWKMKEAFRELTYDWKADTRVGGLKVKAGRNGDMRRYQVEPVILGTSTLEFTRNGVVRSARRDFTYRLEGDVITLLDKDEEVIQFRVSLQDNLLTLASRYSDYQHLPDATARIARARAWLKLNEFPEPANFQDATDVTSRRFFKFEPADNTAHNYVRDMSNPFSSQNNARGRDAPQAAVAPNPAKCSVTQTQMDRILKDIKEEDFDRKMKDMAERVIGSQDCLFSTDQISSVLKLMMSDDYKLEVAMFAYNHTSDKGNYHRLKGNFDFSKAEEKFMAFLRGK